MIKILDLNDENLSKLIDNRWASSDSIADIVEKTYAKNLAIYQNEPAYLKDIPRKKSKVRANRIFVNMESVINSLIANLPKPIILAGRETPESKELARKQEKYFSTKYQKRNVKEQMRKGLRNLYFSRMLVLKPFWNTKINDFDVRAIDPRKLRVGKNATKEDDSEFAIEEIEDNLVAVLKRFPKMATALLKDFGYENEQEAFVQNPDVKYKEAWIRDYVCFKYKNIILGKIRNPYWDWDGLMVTPEEDQLLKSATGDARKNVFSQIRAAQPMRKAVLDQKAQYAKAQAEAGVAAPEPMAPTDLPEGVDNLSAYYFNHFDYPRKPYIFATVFNNENKPIGQTDMITQAAPLQENIDETKRDISDNAKMVNGTLKVDSTVMGKADAQKLRYEVGGVIWGKGVANGVSRETGPALPAFVTENMVDSRKEIDDIMAASAAFKGVREGEETRGGRLALIEQSFLRLNELVQTVDYLNYELFNWFYQLAKVRYTEHHYAKTMGKEQAVETITLIQDDFEDGSEVSVIGGKTLPEDRQFRYEQAQKDMEMGILSPVDYFETAGYDSPSEKAKNRVVFDLNKPFAVGLKGDELTKIVPPPQSEPPSLSLKYEDLPPDGQMQLAEKAGIKLNPIFVFSEATKKNADKRSEMEMKAQSKVKNNEPKK